MKSSMSLSPLHADVEYWRTVVEAAGLGVWDYDIVTGEKNHSSRWFEIRGYADNHQPYQSDEDWFAYLHPDDIATAQEFTALINEGKADDVCFEYRERNAAGEWMWIMCRGRAVRRDDGGRATRFVGIDTDITAMKAAEAAQQAAAKQMQIAFDVAKIGIWTCDVARKLVTWDASQCRIFGLPAKDGPVPSDLWENLIHPDDRARVMAETAQGEAARVEFGIEYRIKRPDGEVRFLRSRVGFIDGIADGACIVGVNWDVTDEMLRTEALEAANEIARLRFVELTKVQRELLKLSQQDPLTGLANRRPLDSLIASFGRRDAQLQNIAILLIDVDNLKQVNDHHGHEAGDAVLVAVADALREKLSPHGLVARTGGDEFIAVICGEMSEEVLQTLARETITAAAQRGKKGGPVPQISVGIASTGKQSSTFGALHRQADVSLYRAKLAGKSRVSLASHGAEQPAHADES